MVLSLQKHGKILLHFFLGIGLPSLLLGYLAFRGVQNDQALLEKEQRSEHSAIAQQITETIDGRILEVEQIFREHIINYKSAQYSGFFHSINILKKDQALVREIFFLDKSRGIQLPFAELLYLFDGNTPSLTNQPLSPSILEAMQTGQQYEFQQNNYEEALISYQKALAQASRDEIKGELLNAIARVQRKSELFPDAIKSYEILIENYSDVRMRNGMPYGLSARLELGSVSMITNDPENALETFTELYQALIHREWTLEKSQYDFTADKTRESIKKILSEDALSRDKQLHQDTFRILMDEERRQRKVTERLLTFQENAAQILLTKIPPDTENFARGTTRFTLDAEGHIYLVSIVEYDREIVEQKGNIWGILLSVNGLKYAVLQPTIQQYIPPDVNWIVRGKTGEIILNSDNPPSGEATVKLDFANGFPPWSLELFQKEPHFLEILTSRHGLYLYMFILLIGILVFGLVLTIRIVNQELELARMKSDFVSTVSHEFKSPLTSIKQLSEMLQDGRIPSEERRQRYYNVLVEQANRLSLLIDNILDFARMEEGRKTFDFRPVDIGTLLAEIISTFQHRISHEGFIIQARIDESLPIILADQTAITQAISNILDNAVKYSGESREIDFRAFAENYELVVAVKDFGIGIDQEEIEQIFERFYRSGDELTRAVKGSGLGLTLVKQIVEAHRGTIQVESEPGSGSIFFIRLPIMEDKGDGENSYNRG